MLASFRRVFRPTDEEIAHDRALLERLHANAVAEHMCSACLFSAIETNGHYSWLECGLDGEDVDGESGRHCWIEQHLPSGAMA